MYLSFPKISTFAVGRIDGNLDQIRLDPTLSFPTCDLGLIMAMLSHHCEVLRGMHGWLACVWLFETWQSFLFLLGCLKWFPSVPEYPTPNSSVKEGTPETDSMRSVFRSYLYLIISKLPLPPNLKTNYPSDWKPFRWFFSFSQAFPSPVPLALLCSY